MSHDRHREALRRRLAVALARRDREPAYSPDWDAAVEEIDEVTAALRGPAAQREPEPASVP